MSNEEENESKSNFIRHIIDADLESGRREYVATRFPPEPNGYLHIGHAKSICLNFGLAEAYDGRCHLRFDDTNPVTEDTEYVESIKRDVEWLGFEWGEHLYFASDYFERMYELAEHLIKRGKAYVDEQPLEAIREQRGSLTEAGINSPHRDRPVDENLRLFRAMRAGEFEDGAMILRAKIDMASPNMLMRDPVLYRIKHASHHRTGDAWCIYPMYDYAHCLEDAFEGITHSICTLEFENNRELYDWVIEETEVEHQPQQIEFARLNLNYTIMSKRKLLKLVEEDRVDGWDDPRMPTIAGMRRRGITPSAIRQFADTIGVSKANSLVDVGLLEFCIRDDLNARAKRVMCVLDPIKVVLTNYPEGEVEELECSYWPEDIPKEDSRKVPFSKVIYIEREDFMEDPPKKYYRLSPGAEVRLRYAYYITCQDVIRDEDGEVVELHCTYDPATRGGWSEDGRKVKGTLHWVSEAGSTPATVRLYDRLFLAERPDADPDRPFTDFLNPESLVTLTNARIEPSVVDDPPGTRFQFERQGYFISDVEESTSDNLVFNRIVTLRDSWSKVMAKLADDEPEVEEPTKPARSKSDDRPDRKSKTEIREEMRAANPEMASRYTRYTEEWEIDPDDADVLSVDLELAADFEAVVQAYRQPQSVANWLLNELGPRIEENAHLKSLPITAEQLADLIRMVDNERVTTAAAREVLDFMLESGRDAETIVAEKGLETIRSEDALLELVQAAIEENPEETERYRDGKTSLLGFFIGKVMQASQGSADAVKVRELLQEHL